MKQTCPDCGGSGYKRVWNESLLEYDRQPCERCGGSGEIEEPKKKGGNYENDEGNKL